MHYKNIIKLLIHPCIYANLHVLLKYCKTFDSSISFYLYCLFRFHLLLTSIVFASLLLTFINVFFFFFCCCFFANHSYQGFLISFCRHHLCIKNIPLMIGAKIFALFNFQFKSSRSHFSINQSMIQNYVLGQGPSSGAMQRDDCPLLSLPPCQLWHRVVLPVRVWFMGQNDQFEN